MATREVLVEGASNPVVIDTTQWKFVKDVPYFIELSAACSKLELVNGLVLDLYGVTISFGEGISVWENILSFEHLHEIKSFQGELKCRKLAGPPDAQHYLLKTDVFDAKLDVGFDKVLLCGLHIVEGEMPSSVHYPIVEYPVTLFFDSYQFDKADQNGSLKGSP